MPLQFDAELGKVKKRLLGMGAIAEEMIRDVKAVLADGNIEALKAVYEKELELDRLQVQLDEESIRLIGVYTPVAGDLRLLLMVTRINAEIERIGDKIVDIGHYLESFLQNRSGPTMVDFAHVTDVAEQMLRSAMGAFEKRSAEQAAAVIRADDEIDRTTDQTFRALFTHMLENPQAVGQILGLMLTAQAIERVADHAVNIAEDVIFMVKGEDIRHLHGGGGADKSSNKGGTS